MDNCIFCKIAQKQIESEIVYENDHIVAFKDLNPIAPIHLLLIPKEHFNDYLELASSPRSTAIFQDLAQAVRDITEKFQIQSFHLINNCGKEAGQSVFHVHFHLISGVDLTKKWTNQ